MHVLRNPDGMYDGDDCAINLLRPPRGGFFSSGVLETWGNMRRTRDQSPRESGGGKPTSLC